jgi:hypothetical protein
LAHRQRVFVETLLHGFEHVLVLPVCTENLMLFDCVTESPNVSGNDRSVMLPRDPVRLAIQIEEPT